MRIWKGLLGPKDIVTPLFNRGHYFLENFLENDYAPKELKVCNGFSPTERRAMHISKQPPRGAYPGWQVMTIKSRMEIKILGRQLQ